MKKKRYLFLSGLALLSIGIASCSSHPEDVEPTISSTTVAPGTTTNPVVSTPTPVTTLPALSTIINPTGSIVKEGAVEVTNVSGQNEAAFVEFKTKQDEAYNLYLTNSTGQETKLTNKDYYIRSISDTESRIDIMGLKADKYSLKIAPTSNESTATTVEFMVAPYDRSGYAHFNYGEGVGAYNNDGTLKDNAIVIYVTDQNKDTVMRDLAEAQEFMFNIPGSSWNNKQADGIGWWLNNTQYSKAVRDSSGNINLDKSSNTYSETGSTLGLYSMCEDHPIVIRFVGTVTTPEGLTAYNSVNEGGTVGDNGHMARMRDLKNITLEGVGDDAVIDGWGVHFIASKAEGRGRNFEARNLTFKNYPEDALGMEGVQEGSTLTNPVSRCWVHHITFLPGYCANPAESDKAEGDGSCDFKRGEYFTMSYCYYEYCHKTNLIGSSDSSLQYHISFHHNTWYNCGSRIPLLRQANIHFYNNYVYGNIDDAKAHLSYVTSLRAESYMFSENNYYEGCKVVFDTKTGTAKCYGNTYLQCFNSPDTLGYTAKTREQTITGANKYINFDTNPDIFYYDSANKKSYCYLTDSVTAKEECIKMSGSNYRTVLNKASLKTTSTRIVDKDMDSIDLDKVTNIEYGVSTTGVEFVSSKSKFKGIGVIFKLNAYATAKVNLQSSNSSSMYAGYLVKNDGKVCIAGSGEAVLAPGIYVIISSSADKETTLASLSFEKYNSEELANECLKKYNEALAKLLEKEVAYNDNYYLILKDTIEAYNAIPADYQSQADYESLSSKIEQYKKLGAKEVETLISAIGTVNENSLGAITLANDAYDKLIGQFADVVVSNYQVLVDANIAYKSYAVEACIKAIDAIGEVTLESENAITYALKAYDKVSEDNKNLITNYNALEAAVAKLASLKKIKNVNSMIDEATSMEEYAAVVDAYYQLTNEEMQGVLNSTKLNNILVSYEINLIDSIGTVNLNSKDLIDRAQMLYDKLSEDNKALVTNYSKLLSAEEEYNELQASALFITFEDLKKEDGEVNPNGEYPVFKFGIVTIEGRPKDSVSKEYNGTTYKGAMKVESQTKISFTLTEAKTITLVTDCAAGKKIRLNGEKYTVGENGVFTFELKAGTYEFTKQDSMNIFIIIIA